ncbi:hypothetical protein MCOR02_003250 [Pyricularia oryzae]|nr:hypothetical protein MCOR02_003250 [Pyricularia oryzae]KAI6325857.1 hypothetical protein MCOR34_001067 [Pyricularia oryzae]KAI6476488.1 hypothetical protein MCOR17_001058 [Pyricularia oryzae]KAI6511559.1 hypothetical protein MCOR13_000527 [Pyricularia oryzae]KAI6602439.1 hypothetical protein MCOR04_002014 [Pyricularia oryzae]
MGWAAHLVVLALMGATLLLARLVHATTTRIYRHKHIWDKLDCVGGVSATSSTPTWIAALFRSISGLQDAAQDGYDRFVKSATRGPRPFVLPTMWTGGPIVVLPPSMLPLVNRSPSHETGVPGLLEQFQFRYLHPDPDVWANTAIHFDVVRRDMAQKNMAPLAATIAGEWAAAFRACWDEDPAAAGKTVGVGGVSAWDSGVRIMARVAMRVLVGLPGCRDESFFELSQLYARAFIVDGVAINCLPPVLRPLLAPVLALRARHYQRRVVGALVPLVEQRLARAAVEEADKTNHEPGDVIRWLIARSAAEGNPEQMQPVKIARRVVALMSMFGFAIGWVFAHALLDIYGGPSRDDVVAGLEDECDRVRRRHGGSIDTKEAVEALFRVDSAVRESMRLSDVSVHILPLDVVAGEGIDLGGGVRITPGCGLRAVFPAQMVHADPGNYADPKTYDAFRFSRPFEADVVQQDGGANGDEREKKRELMTTTTATFLSFGYGRRSCPGRWLVAHMVKQALAHVVLNYHVEVTQRPGPRRALLNFMLPAEAARIAVNRKKNVQN